MENFLLVKVANTFENLLHEALNQQKCTLIWLMGKRIRFLKSPAKSCSTYSNTRKVEPRKRFLLLGLDTIISLSLTIFGCLIRLRSSISE